MVVLTPRTPEQVYSIWSWVRDGLQKSIDKTQGHGMPEDIYVRLRGGNAWLYVIDVDGHHAGFAILTREHDPDGLVMFIWCLWCEPHSMWETRGDLYDALDALARTIGARRIRMWSPRRWWERQPFFKQVSAVYEHEVENAPLP